MITAKEARKRTDAILKPVEKSAEFKAIMDRIESDINAAVNDGLESIVIKTHVLPVLNGYHYPEYINRNAIDSDHFWWPYVKAELERNGFSCCSTMTCDTYRVCW